MKIRMVTILLGLIASSSAFGSYVLKCKMTGTPTFEKLPVLNGTTNGEKLPYLVKIAVKEAVELGAPIEDRCLSYEGNDFHFLVKDASKFFGRKSVTIEYKEIKTRSGKNSFKVKLIDPIAVSHALEVKNLETDWVNLMPGARKPGPIYTGVNFEAKVISSGCTKASDFKVKVIQMNNGDQVLSIQRAFRDFCRAAKREITLKMHAESFKLANTLIYNGKTKKVKVNAAH